MEEPTPPLPGESSFPPQHRPQDVAAWHEEVSREELLTLRVYHDFALSLALGTNSVILMLPLPPGSS